MKKRKREGMKPDLFYFTIPAFHISQRKLDSARCTNERLHVPLCCLATTLSRVISMLA